jgi:DNA-binding PadR family transcriptional regulator
MSDTWDPKAWHHDALEDTELSTSAKALVGLLATRELAERREYVVDKGFLAKSLGTSERTIYRALRDAERRGWLEVHGIRVRGTRPNSRFEAAGE